MGVPYFVQGAEISTKPLRVLEILDKKQNSTISLVKTPFFIGFMDNNGHVSPNLHLMSMTKLFPIKFYIGYMCSTLSESKIQDTQKSDRFD